MGKTENTLIVCTPVHFCESPVSDKHKDARGRILPYCNVCGIFYQPKHVFDNGKLAIIIVPRPERDTYRDTDEIPPLHKGERHRYTNKPQHKDVKGQILDLLQEHTTRTTAEIQTHIDASNQSIHTALNDLVEHKKIRKIKRGVYQTMDTTDIAKKLAEYANEKVDNQ